MADEKAAREAFEKHIKEVFETDVIWDVDFEFPRVDVKKANLPSEEFLNWDGCLLDMWDGFRAAFGQTPPKITEKCVRCGWEYNFRCSKCGGIICDNCKKCHCEDISKMQTSGDE
jgi:hypothetical protein